jgi:hypothetical protein
VAKTNQNAAYQVVGDSGTSDTTTDSSLVPLNALSSATVGAQASQMTFMTDASASPLTVSTRGHHVSPWFFDPTHQHVGTGEGADVPGDVHSVELVINGVPEDFDVKPAEHPIATWNMALFAKEDFNDPLTPAGAFTLLEHHDNGTYTQIGNTKHFSHINKGLFTLEFDRSTTSLSTRYKFTLDAH